MPSSILLNQRFWLVVAPAVALGGCPSAARSPGTTTTTTSSSSSSATGGGSSSGGGGGGSNQGGAGGAGGAGGLGGHHGFATADAITLGAATPTQGTLVSPFVADFYTFSGNKGDHVLAVSKAQALTGDANHQDPTVIDTVVTLYDAGMNVVALDDDANPRNGSTDSVLTTELPADGVYYLTIEDCNSYAAGPNSPPGLGCSSAKGIVTLEYALSIAVLDPTKVAHADTSSSPPMPSATLTYVGVPSTPGAYFEQFLYGDFGATGDTHTFTLDLSALAAPLAIDAAHRPRAYFWVQARGKQDGDGSTTNVALSVTSDAAPGVVIASSDQNDYTNGDDANDGDMELSFPLDVDWMTNAVIPHTYTLTVTNTGTPGPAGSFYFIDHGLGSLFLGTPDADGPTGPDTNGTQATAQGVAAPPGEAGSFFIDGDIGPAGDVDWFSLAVPTTVPTSNGTGAPDHVSLACSALRDGSGLAGFEAELLDQTGSGDGVAVVGPQLAPAKAALGVGGLDDVTLGTIVPGTNALLRVSATGQDATDTGTYYTCRVSFFSTM